jgi:uncharacterized protein
MEICVIGDIHGNFPKVDEILETTNADLYLQVGDLGAIDILDEKSYTPFQKPIYFIPGNHENYDYIEEYHNTYIHDTPMIRKNLYLIPYGHYFNYKGLTIGGLGGNYSPKRYEWNRDNLYMDRRKHFVKDDVDRLKTAKHLDILLTHEAPKPFRYFPNMYDLGVKYINELLDELKPKYHFFGHHHKYWEKQINDTQCYCIPICDYRLFNI